MNDDDKNLLDEVEAEVDAADTVIREAVQPLLFGSPAKIFGVATALARLSVEVTMMLRNAKEEDPFGIGIDFLDTLRKQLEEMRAAGVPPPRRCIEIRGPHPNDPPG